MVSNGRRMVSNDEWNEEGEKEFPGKAGGL